MNRDLDEIEAELGKERTLKVGDKVKIEGREGKIIHECQALLGRWHVEYEGIPGTCCVSASVCIPVEPERVKWYYRMSCATRSCAANDEGMCNVSINGLATCSKHQWPKPSPGLLQRMGMCVWACDAKDWCVFFQPALMTEAEAHDFASRYKSAKVFRWQDGVQG